MGDWPAQSQDYNQVTIHTGSAESLGADNNTAAAQTVTSTVWPAANRAIYVPFVVYQPLIAVKLFMLNGAAVSGNVDVGIYDSQQNRLVSSGSTVQAGTSATQTFDTTDTTLYPGVYYFALAADNTVATVSAGVPALAIVQSLGVLSQSTAFALPATATFVAAQDAVIPVIGLTSRTVV